MVSTEAMELRMRDAVGEIQLAIDYLKGRAEVNGRFGATGLAARPGRCSLSLLRKRKLSCGENSCGAP